MRFRLERWLAASKLSAALPRTAQGCCGVPAAQNDSSCQAASPYRRYDRYLRVGPTERRWDVSCEYE